MLACLLLYREIPSRRCLPKLTALGYARSHPLIAVYRAVGDRFVAFVLAGNDLLLISVVFRAANEKGEGLREWLRAALPLLPQTNGIVRLHGYVEFDDQWSKKISS